MFEGDVINKTEKRQVWHVKLRDLDGKDETAKAVQEVGQRIKSFSENIRSHQTRGFTHKAFQTIVAIGIGGSYLGPEFVYEALRVSSQGRAASSGIKLKFLANVDPIDFESAVEGIDVETTLFIIVSKTFTTAETMLNARQARQFIRQQYEKLKIEGDVVASHLCAVSTNLTATKSFGIKDENVFGFWDWVGGRFSVSSAVGMLPLSLQFGYDIVEQFLQGLHSVDTHFNSESVEKNVPVMLGLIGFYNTYICGLNSRALLPYCQALKRFPAHIQQLDMESNGKSVTLEGQRLSEHAGPIIFGEPGTNGQHSFYQLMHQGRVIASEFIGFTESQARVDDSQEVVSAHAELMSNFFAQPDALALGKSIEQLQSEGVPENLQQHKFFPGDRPSLSILFKGELTARSCGQLLALYEHRVAVEGFVYGINSFDQWGVELGKVLAKDVRSVFEQTKKDRKSVV